MMMMMLMIVRKIATMMIALLPGNENGSAMEREAVETGDDHDDDAYDLGFAYECDYEDSDNDDSSVAW